MPELPEVETVRRGLERLMAGRRFSSVEVLFAPSFSFEPDASKLFEKSTLDGPLVGAACRRFRRRGKVLIIDLDSGYSLVMHLKMTGQLVFDDPSLRQHFGAGHPDDSLVDSLPDRSTRVIFSFGEARLFFNDQRKFGWIRLMPTDAVESIDFLRKMGPEPLDDSFTEADFARVLGRRAGSQVKAALLDQTVVAGIGNIYADESLWAAGIHPATRVSSLDSAAVGRLYAAVRDALRLGIDSGGSTDRNYVDAEGHRGAYLDFAAVFRREGEPCRRCGAIIEKTRVAGRGTHICPVCQKLIE
jgi:formamidopyrimidine-DNA glycosylase